MTGPDVLQRWHQLVAARDHHGIDELLAEDVVFHSPAVHTPQAGRAITRKYLEAALHVFGNEAFRYVNEWRAGRSAVLEFETLIGGIEVNGVDIIHWNDAGRIVRFKVMVRPVKALQTVMASMAKELQK